MAHKEQAPFRKFFSFSGEPFCFSFLRIKIREAKLKNLRSFAPFIHAALMSRACEECARITLIKRCNLSLPCKIYSFFFVSLSRYIFTLMQSKHREDIYLFQGNL